MDFPYQTLTQGQIRLLTIDLTEGEPFQLSLNHYPYDASLEYATPGILQSKRTAHHKCKSGATRLH